MADRIEQPFRTNKHIKNRGPYIGAMRDALYGVRNLDWVEVMDDFHGDVITNDGWATATDTDGSHDKIAGALNGTSTLDVGDGATSGDNEYGGIALGLEWKGDNNAFMAARINMSAITTVKVEVGFTDALADAGAVNVLATPTYTATDCALWAFDTDDTGPTTTTWQGIGVKASTGITKVETVPTGAIETPVASTFQTMCVALEGDAARYVQLDANQNLVADSGWQANAIEGGTLITPWLFVQNRAATIDRLITIDYVYVAQQRS